MHHHKWFFRITAFTAFFFMLFDCPVSAQAGTYSKAELEKLIKEGTKIVVEGNEPSAEFKKKIGEVSNMVQAGEIEKSAIVDMVKKEMGQLVQSVKISRYDIKRAMKTAPQMLPGVTAKEFHQSYWDVISPLMKEKIHLKVGTLAPEGTAWLEVPRKILSKHLSKLSKGKFSFKMYTGGVMGEDVDILRKMDVGQLDGCGCTALGVFKAAPELGVFFLPNLFRDYKEVDYILNKFRNEFDATLKKKGYILASLIDTGFFYLWSANPVRKLEDLKRQRVMTWFGPVETTTYKEMGISPIPVSVPEIVTSMNTGMVNATYGPGPWILGTQAYTMLKYYVTQPLFYSPAAIIFRANLKDKFKGGYTQTTIDNIQELLIYETMSFERVWIDKHLRPYEQKAMKAFRDYGIKPVTLSDADMKKLGEISKKVWYKLADKVYPKSLLERVLKELENYRKSH